MEKVSRLECEEHEETIHVENQCVLCLDDDEYDPRMELAIQMEESIRDNRKISEDILSGQE